MGLTLGHTTSASEEIARAVPGAQVVKAFNNVFAQVLADGANFCNGQKVSVFVPSDSEQGVGASAANLVPGGEVIAQAGPDTAAVSVDGPHPSSLGQGREWFSVVGGSEENRPGRIARVMPLFPQTVRHWQHASGIAAQATSLVGFSQGAILALEAGQVEDVPPVALRTRDGHVTLDLLPGLGHGINNRALRLVLDYPGGPGA